MAEVWRAINEIFFFGLKIIYFVLILLQNIEIY